MPETGLTEDVDAALVLLRKYKGDRADRFLNLFLRAAVRRSGTSLQELLKIARRMRQNHGSVEFM